MTKYKIVILGLVMIYMFTDFNFFAIFSSLSENSRCHMDDLSNCTKRCGKKTHR